MLHALFHFYNAAPPEAKSAARAGAAFLAGAALAVLATACSPAHAEPADRGTIAPGAEKHCGLGRPESAKAQQPRPPWTAAFFMPTNCAWRTASFTVGRVGAPARVRRYLIPVFQPHTACHPRLEAGAAGSQPVDKEPFMADTLTLKGRIAPAAPTRGADESQLFALHLEAVNCAALARWYAARHRHTEAARKMRQGLAALNRLKAMEVAV